MRALVETWCTERNLRPVAVIAVGECELRQFARRRQDTNGEESEEDGTQKAFLVVASDDFFAQRIDKAYDIDAPVMDAFEYDNVTWNLALLELSKFARALIDGRYGLYEATYLPEFADLLVCTWPLFTEVLQIEVSPTPWLQQLVGYALGTSAKLLRTFPEISKTDDASFMLAQQRLAVAEYFTKETEESFQEYLDNLTLSPPSVELLTSMKQRAAALKRKPKRSDSRVFDAVLTTRHVPSLHDDKVIALRAAHAESVRESPQIQAVLSKLGASLCPSKVLFVARVGSYMYNLDIATSDRDYFIVFCEDTRALMSASAPQSHYGFYPLKEMVVDKADIAEGSAIELSRFLDSCIKGTVRALECLFATRGIVYQSPVWQYIAQQLRPSIVSQQAVGKFLGFADSHLHKLRRAESGQSEKASFRRRKLVYHAAKKLFDLRTMALGKAPVITLADESSERRFILEARNGEIDLEQAIVDVNRERQNVVALLRQHECDVPPLVERTALQRLLRIVRAVFCPRD